MHQCTINYGHLKIDWSSQGTLTLARDDRPESVQLSNSEVRFMIEALRLMGWPVAPDTPTHTMPT